MNSINIIFEDNNYLVIDKPSGIAVHAGGNIVGPTLVDWLLDYYPKIKTIGEDPIRPGIVHRLDKEVSGLMVIAKTQESFNDLKQQFKNRTIHKQYTALVHGQLSKAYDTINFPIKRSSEGYKMAAMPHNTDHLLIRHNPKNRDRGNIEGTFKSKEAITEFQILQKLINYTLIKVTIKTGRTHQIRVHFFAYGHPLVGDNLYCTSKTKVKNKKINLSRIFLVADSLSFLNLDKKELSFSINLPSILQKKLKELK